MNESKISKIIITLLTLILIILLAVIIYVISSKESLNNQNTDNNMTDNVDNTTDNSEDDYNIDESIIEKYFVMLDNNLTFNYDGEVSKNSIYVPSLGKNSDVYTNDLITFSSDQSSNLLFNNTNVNDIEDNYKIAIAFNYANPSFYNNLEDGINTEENMETISADQIKIYIKNFFGPDIQYSNISFGIGSAYYYTYESGVYNLQVAQGGTGSNDYVVRPIIYDTKTTDEEIEIYASKVYIEYNYNFSNIDNLYISNDDAINNNNAISIDNVEQYNSSNIMTAKSSFYDYLDNFENYKYTFKKSSDGNYYYYSTEKI